MDLGSVVTVIAIVAVVAVVFMTQGRVKERRAELQAEIQSKLIDRFQSAPELIEFLRSPTGQEFVSGVKTQQATLVTRKMLAGIRFAVFFAVLGIGFLVLWPLTNNEGFFYPGVLLLALGGGFYFSTVVALKVSRAWGMDQRDTVQTSAGDVR